MIVNKVAKFLESEGKTAYKLVQETGLNNGTVYKLKNNPNQYPAKETLDTLCRVYGNSVSDWIEFVEG